jgi:hypothetical protein
VANKKQVQTVLVCLFQFLFKVAFRRIATRLFSPKHINMPAKDLLGYIFQLEEDDSIEIPSTLLITRQGRRLKIDFVNRTIGSK